MLLALTEQTQKIVTRNARDIAVKLGHSHVGTEHLLLALIEENSDNTGLETIKKFHLDLNKLKEEIKHFADVSQGARTDQPAGDTRFTRQGLRVVECAREEAHVMGHNYVGTEHIFLGLIREGEGIAYRVLSKHGITITRARREVWHVLNIPSGDKLPGRTKDIESTMTDEAGARIIEDKKSAVHPDVYEILINERQIKKRVQDIGLLISREYTGKEPLLISVLKGSIIFLADLLREISIPCRFDLMTVSSYGSKTETSGKVKLVMDLKQEVKGRDIIVVEDIFDTGHTMAYILEHIKDREPASVKVCVLLSKKRKHEIEIPLDYVGFEIPDKFVVGYGLDYAERYRHLPYIAVLKPEIYNS